jgi:DNA polymerase-3 subunit alpha
MRVKSIAEVMAARTDGFVKLAGTVISKKERVSQRGNKFAFVQMSDPSGVFEITVFSEILNEYRDILVAGQSVIVNAGVAFEGETPRFTTQSLEPLDEVALRAALTLMVVLDGPDAVPPLHDLLDREGKGRGRVKLVARTGDDTEITVDLGGRYKVSPEIMMAVKSLRGVAEVHEV